MSLLKDKKIVIVGLGVLGGSYAKGLSKAGIYVDAIDIDEEALRFAAANHWIRNGSSDVSLVKDADIIISCLYPRTFVSWVEENQHLFKPQVILTDVTGVKREVIRQIRSFLRKDAEYISCHPMAGRESKGLAFADEERFLNANFIIVPTQDNSEYAISLAKEIAVTLKFGKIRLLDAESHDAMIGFLSQLTHVIAVCLMNVQDRTSLADYTGDSFRDLTRIANINEDLWPQLFTMNKDILVDEIQSFCKEMELFAILIQTQDEETMREKLIQSTKRRKAFDKV